ncbi:MAG: 3'(2'),5'-bisphosphate nucleotidase [Planctomycetaceae bacterium]|nr:3'(2'),5'-bisphosphate nucleotidase [Planctomycetaceae bacterium]
MSDSFSKEHRVAIEAVARAARVCQRVQSQIQPETLEKKDRSPVTIADYASQAIVCHWIRESFPADPVLAEEDAIALRDGESSQFLDRIVEELVAGGLEATPELAVEWIDLGGHDGSASRFWTLDPIDGTKGFLRKEQFAVSLALLIDGVIQVAALACPNLDPQDGSGTPGVILSAVRGQGAWTTPLSDINAKPQPIRVTATSDISACRVCESVESGHSDHSQSGQIMQELGITAEAVRLDSQAKYAVVARGEADLYLRLPTRKDYREKIWDHAGGVLVVEEAGGKATDVDGKELDFSLGSELANNRGVVVTNGHIHDVVLQAVGKCLADSNS